MRVFVESLKRLYSTGKVTQEKIISLWYSGKLMTEEKDYILTATA